PVAGCSSPKRGLSAGIAVVGALDIQIAAQARIGSRTGAIPIPQSDSEISTETTPAEFASRLTRTFCMSDQVPDQANGATPLIGTRVVWMVWLPKLGGSTSNGLCDIAREPTPNWTTGCVTNSGWMNQLN